MIEVFKVVFSLSLSGAILILAVSLICKLLGRRLSKRWQYYIWIVVMLRLLIPYAPHITIINQVMQVANNDIFHAVQIEDIENAVNMDFMSPEQIKVSGLSEIKTVSDKIINYLGITWLAVAVILFVRKITIYQSFIKYVRAGKTEIADIDALNYFSEICEQIGINDSVDLSSNGLIASPLLIGIIRPRVVLPTLSMPLSDLRYIYLHELTHLKRRDIIYKWFSQIILCLHWFNPLVHYMAYQVNRICELSCDEAVIKTLNTDEKIAYGNTLIESLKTTKTYREPIAALTLSENAVLLHERLTAIKNIKDIAKRTLVLSLAFTICLSVCGLLLGAYLPITDGNNITVTDTTPNPLNDKSSAVDETVCILIESGGANDGVWFIIGYLIPYMSNDGIDKAVALFNQSYGGSAKIASAYYDYPIPSQADTVFRALEILSRTRNWTLIKSLFPYMSNSGIGEVVAYYNQQSGGNVNPANFHHS